MPSVPTRRVCHRFTPQQFFLCTILTVGSQYFAPNHFSRFICVVCWNKHATCSERKLLKRHSLWRCEYFFSTTRQNDRHDAPSGLFVFLSPHKRRIFPPRRHNAIWCRRVAAPHFASQESFRGPCHHRFLGILHSHPPLTGTSASGGRPAGRRGTRRSCGPTGSLPRGEG